MITLIQAGCVCFVALFCGWLDMNTTLKLANELSKADPPNFYFWTLRSTRAKVAFSPKPIASDLLQAICGMLSWRYITHILDPALLLRISALIKAASIEPRSDQLLLVAIKNPPCLLLLEMMVLWQFDGSRKIHSAAGEMQVQFAWRKIFFWASHLICCHIQIAWCMGIWVKQVLSLASRFNVLSPWVPHRQSLCLKMRNYYSF